MPPPGKRGKYLGFVAHEIKNPLATALWSCDLLKRMDAADRGGERAEKMIDVSLRALRRMRRLIEDFFTIERLLEHGYDLKQEKIALKDLVEPALHTPAEKDGISTDGWVVQLLLDAFADVAGDVLDLALQVVELAFALELSVARRDADGLLDLALGLIQFAFGVLLAHVGLLSRLRWTQDALSPSLGLAGGDLLRSGEERLVGGKDVPGIGVQAVP